jgi:cardiolipin synthase
LEPRLIVDGENALREILRRISEARFTIRIRMFMWRDDVAGNLVLDALRTRIEACPDIRIFIEKDAFGSSFYDFQNFITFGRLGGDIFSSVSGREFLKNTPNVHFSKIGSARLLLIKYLRENDHSKIFLFDELTSRSVALIGGMNVADEYLSAQDETAPNGGGWHDYMVELRGELSDAIVAGKRRKAKKWMTKPLRFGVEIFMTVRNRRSLRQQILAELSRAKESIIVEHGYLTDAAILKRLRRMSFQGIDVKVIVPEKSDGVRHANMRSLFRLLRPPFLKRRHAKPIGAYLYPGMIHAKAILIDGNVAILGSANLTYGSFDLLYETSAIFRGECGVVADLKIQLEKDILKSRSITIETIPPYRRWLAWLQGIFI